MSFGEFFIIILVGLVILKPTDIPCLVKYIKKLYQSFAKFKKDLEKEFQEVISDSSINPEDKETINFYLKKIAEIGSTYEGEYNISDVKKYYQKLVKSDKNIK